MSERQGDRLEECVSWPHLQYVKHTKYIKQIHQACVCSPSFTCRTVVKHIASSSVVWRRLYDELSGTDSLQRYDLEVQACLGFTSRLLLVTCKSAICARRAVSALLLAAAPAAASCRSRCLCCSRCSANDLISRSALLRIAAAASVSARARVLTCRA